MNIDSQVVGFTIFFWLFPGVVGAMMLYMKGWAVDNLMRKAMLVVSPTCGLVSFFSGLIAKNREV